MKKRSMEHLLKKPTKKIRILGGAVLSVFAIIFSIYYISVVAPATANAFSGAGKGTQDDPYQIANCEQLQEMQLDNDAVYVLVNDVDCNDTVNWNSGLGFKPVIFKGTLDGRNYAIRGLYVNRSTNGSPSDANSGFAAGLFRSVSSAYVKNLWLLNGPSTEGKVAIKGTNNVGALAGELRSGSVITNVHTELNVAAVGGTSADNNGSVGGLAGLNRGSISLSSSTGKVSLLNNAGLQNKGFKLGGLVGHNDGPVSVSDSEDPGSQGIDNSFASGGVEADASDQAFQSLQCGGLVGEQSALKYIISSYAEGKVNCQNSQAVVGGLVGQIDGAQEYAPLITQSFTRSEIVNESSGDYGGVYGDNQADEQFGNQAIDLASAYFDITRTQQENCGPNTETIPCAGVNAGNSEADYFTAIENPPLSGWATDKWRLQDGALPAHQTQAVRPDAVPNFQVTRDGDDFVFTWDAPLEENGRNKDINGYSIEAIDVGNGGSTSIQGTPDASTTFRWSGLEIPNSYKFRIRAEVPNGISGLFTDYLEFATGMPAVAPAKDKVESVVHSAKVSWLAVDGATQYDVQYRKTGTDAWSDSGGATGALSRTIIGLEAGTSYDYRVKALNKAGSGPWSEPFAAITNLPTERAITSCQELQDLASIEDNYYLTNDIDCSSVANFNPIPAFMGTFDGRGHVIRNLTIQVDADSPAQIAGVGLFGSTVNAEIRNVSFEHSSVITNYSLGDSVDEDQNGLPDLGDLTIEPVELPDGTVGSVASLQQQAVDTALSAGQSAQSLGSQLYVTVPQLASSSAKVSTGTVVGISFGTSKFQNISVDDGLVTGAITGGIFGIILPTPQLLSNKFSDAMFSDPMVFDDLNYQGLVFGNVSGGLIGLATSNTGSIFGSPGSLTIQNSRSDANVQANVGGGAIGAAISLSVASTYPVAATLSNTTNDLFGIGSDEMVAAVNRTVSTQDIIIKNTITSGEISVCEATTQVRMASLGGFVGVGAGVLIDDSQTSSKITTCSQTTSNWGVYGGFMGGMGGTMLFSRVHNSSSSGDMLAINNRSPEQYAPGIFVGATGGVAGFMLNMSDDADGRYAIDNVQTAGNTQVSGSRGLVAASGGITGIYIGSGTFKDSSSSGRIIQAQPEENLMGAMFAGGVSGVTLAFDAPFAYGTFFKYLAGKGFPEPTHGLNLTSVHATGDIVAQKSTGGSFSVSGGLMGLMVGQGTVTDSYATGNVTNDLPRDVRLKIAGAGGGNSLFEQLFGVIGGGQGHFGAAVSGGMFGAVYGVDSVGAISTVSSAITTFGQDNAYLLNKGFVLNNSYATGDVKGNLAGGIFGAAEFNVKVNKTYSTGKINGDIAGGLIGESGFLSFFPQGGAIYGTISIFKDYSSNTQYYDGIIKLMDNGIKTLGAVEVTNTYTTGSVTGTPGLLRAEVPEGEQVGYIDVIDKLPVTVGGIVGLNMGLGMKLKDSYASGDITVLARDPSYTKPQEGLPSITNIPNFAGGIVGLNVATPMFSAEGAKNLIIEGNGVPGYFPDISRASFAGNEFSNLFSASKININSQTITGGAFGWFFSPVNAANAFYGGSSSIELSQPDKIAKVENVYLDKSNVKVADCSNSTKITDVGKSIFSSAFIPGPGEQNSVPAWNIPEGYNQVIDSVVGKPACRYVNENNTQPSYFINNKTNAPLDQWNFSNIWKVQKNDYPKFVAGAETDTPSGPVSTPSVPTNSTTTASPVSSPITKTLNELARRRTSGDVGSGGYNWLQNLLRNLPPLLVLSIPYLLIAALLALAVRYAKQALDQYRELRRYHNAILRLLATKDAINDFLAVTTHYLNTPVAVMRGAVELMQSMKKVPTTVASALSAKITAFSEEASKLITANEVSSAESANVIKPIQYKAANPFAQREVWLPSVISLVLLAVANVLFMYASVYNRSWVRISIELGCILMAIGLLGFSYRYRDSIEQSKRVAKQQLDEETVFYKKRQDFIGHAAIVTHDSHLALELASNNLRDHTEAKLFFNGLNMLGGIATSLGNLKKFSAVDDNPPLLDVTSLVKKSVTEARDKARAKNIMVTSHIADQVVVRFEPDEMRQLVNSLLDNAIKFGKDNGQIALNVERNHRKVRIQVHDNGEGISREKLPSLLKPFARGTDSMQYNKEGLGLSLYTNKILIDKLGGKINIESQLGKGTIVTIEIPAHHDAKGIIPMLLTTPKPA